MMMCGFKVYIKERESGKIGMFYKAKLTDDIKQSIIDLMLDNSDSDFECIKVVFNDICYFEI